MVPEALCFHVVRPCVCRVSVRPWCLHDICGMHWCILITLLSVVRLRTKMNWLNYRIKRSKVEVPAWMYIILKIPFSMFVSATSVVYIDIFFLPGVSFVFVVSFLCFFCVFSRVCFKFDCQCQCRWLPGKTHLRNDLLYVEQRDVETTPSVLCLVD